MINQDINFDALADRFERNIYGGIKGAIRLAVLTQDLKAALPQLGSQHALQVLDAGGGLGQFSRQLAQQGQRVTLCDISATLLERAQAGAALDSVAHLIEWRHQSIQQLAATDPGRYDVVLCHAVLEWTADPASVVASLLRLMAPRGYLSLMFYNHNALIYRNLLRGNFRKLAALEAGHIDRVGETLTPISPLQPDTVRDWLAEQHMTVIRESGVRVFYDNMLLSAQQHHTADDIIAQELAYASQEPYRRLGRYYHIIAQRAPATPHVTEDNNDE